MKNQKGFTLIELLVVIAIIGILASVVLASLNSARNKGADAAIKADLTNTRAQAELYYDNNSSSYAPTPYALAACPTTISTGNIYADTNVFNALSQAIAQSGQTAAAGSRCVATASAWATAVMLKTGGTAGDTIPDTWCVDSTGQAKAQTWAAGGTIALSTITATSCL